ncbi:MFS general substrate transporter [Pluteus cervinus]|uniref:MFS general substrate transporter n=1 Tax=Pluteus cervinus TaxID=181527 RepID=A0ACD3AL74_9AGAR|nr:MFS general substrate transporter [Pluteus cervinus]
MTINEKEGSLRSGGLLSDTKELGAEPSEKEVRRVLRKMDLRILPLVSLLYLLSFLDRSNIGNARVAGMATDAHLDGLKYNVIVAVYFIAYAFADVPSNIALKLVRPSRWLPAIMVAWGVVMTLMSLCNTYQQLIAARVFLGLTEAGFFPGVAFYLSLWYRRKDVASRIAIFYSAATISGAFGGLLAFGIEKMEGVGGLHGWQWIFCLEGIVTVVVATASFFFMYDYPETATFLTESERVTVVDMLKRDTLGQATHFDMKFVWQAITDYKTYVQIGINMGLVIPAYAISLFLPTIVNELGFSAAQAQLLSVPPFVIGCVGTISVGFLSDRLNLRGPFIIAGAFVSLVGYIILDTQDKPGSAYVGTILVAVGVYSTIAVDVAWASSTAGGDVRKGVVIALVIGVGNLGGICSSFIYFDPPRFFAGHGTMMGWLSLTILLSIFTMWDFNHRNKKREEYCKQNGIDESNSSEFADAGSESPLFRFTL